MNFGRAILCTLMVGGLGVSPALARALATPAQILAAIQTAGAQAVVNELFQDGQSVRWAHVIDRIETGDARWLEVAAALEKGSDAGATEELYIAVAHALLRAPERVLAMVSEQPAANGTEDFPIDVICTMPDIEPPLAIYRAYIRRARAALDRVHDPALAGKRARCIAEFNALPPG